MGALWMTLVSSVSTVIVATEFLTTEYHCGPICPPLNVTMNSCVTLCPGQELGEESDPNRLFFLAEKGNGEIQKRDAMHA
ncbi:hypothetical protein MTO96_044411 [Rhipicephalus appendiculatus]